MGIVIVVNTQERYEMCGTLRCWSANMDPAGFRSYPTNSHREKAALSAINIVLLRAM